MPAPTPSGTGALDRAPKMALAIGIDTYSRGWPNKQNAVADAKAVAGELMRSGYKVAVLENPGAQALQRAFKQFLLVDGDKPEARLVVWFSGQSHTLAGQSFLVPADAPLPNREQDFRATAVSLEDYVSLLRRSSAAQVYTVIDAPVAAIDFSGRASADRDPSTAPYLPVRQFLSSAAVGQAAADDGLFRRTFLRTLAGINPADSNHDKLLTADEIGPYMRDRISALTKNHQTPLYGRLPGSEYAQGDYAFTPATAYRNGYGNVPRPASDGDGQEIENMVWNSIQKSDDPHRFELFLKLYPDGAHAEQAYAKLSQLISPVAVAAHLPIADDERAVPAASLPTPARISRPAVTSMELIAPPRPAPAVTVQPAPAAVTELEPTAAPVPRAEPVAAVALVPPVAVASTPSPPVTVVVSPPAPTRPANFLPPEVAAAIVGAPATSARKAGAGNPFDQDSVPSMLPVLASVETFDGEMAEPADAKEPAAAPVALPDPIAPPESHLITPSSPGPGAFPAMVAVGPAMDTPRSRSQAQPAALTSAGAGSPAASGGRSVQLGAYRNPDAAKKHLDAWKAQFPNLFDGSNVPVVSLADLGEQGVFYRVRVNGFDDAHKAADFCSVFRGEARDCYIVPEH